MSILNVNADTFKDIRNNSMFFLADKIIYELNPEIKAIRVDYDSGIGITSNYKKPSTKLETKVEFRYDRVDIIIQTKPQQIMLSTDKMSFNKQELELVLKLINAHESLTKEVCFITVSKSTYEIKSLSSTYLMTKEFAEKVYGENTM